MRRAISLGEAWNPGGGDVFSDPRAEPLYLVLEEPRDGERLTFEMFVDGGVYLSEEIEIEMDGLSRRGVTLDGPAAPPVVELLAADSGRLAHLYRISDERQVEVVVRRGSVRILTETFMDLVAESQVLVAEGVRPQGLRSTFVEPASEGDLFHKNGCIEFCDDQQDDCYLNRCGQFGSASCYDACDREWLDCLENCGICTPSTTSTTTFTSVGLTAQNVFECHTTSSEGLGIYRRFLRRVKRTVTTTTTNADCSQTLTTEVSYFNEPCWGFLYQSNCANLGPICNLCVS